MRQLTKRERNAVYVEALANMRQIMECGLDFAFVCNLIRDAVMKLHPDDFDESRANSLYGQVVIMRDAGIYEEFMAHRPADVDTCTMPWYGYRHDRFDFESRVELLERLVQQTGEDE